MVEFHDNAILLSSRPFGEDAAVVQVLTASHGRYAGLVRGGQSRRTRPILQPGNAVRVAWRARLDEHLGQMAVELETAYAAQMLDDRLRLSVLSSLATLLSQGLAEREPSARLYEASLAMLDLLASENPPEIWLAAYIRWEIGLLEAAGFALQLDRCVVSGAEKNLCYVSPKTGGAVTAEAAGAHAPRLLILPSFLGGMRKSLEQDLINGMRMSGHFIYRQLFALHHKPMAEARQRLETLVAAEYGAKYDIREGQEENGRVN